MIRQACALAMACASASACNPVIIDTSKGAVEALDYTLAGTLNEAAPGRGVDSLRRKEGSPIDSYWTLVLPPKHKGGEANVQYRDVSMSYGIKENQVQLAVPLKDFFSHPKWEYSDSGTMVAFLKLLYDSRTGLAEARARGFAFIIIHDASYDPLPVDGSGFVSSQTVCKIYYTTAGRSSVSCK